MLSKDSCFLEDLLVATTALAPAWGAKNSIELFLCHGMWKSFGNLEI